MTLMSVIAAVRSEPPRQEQYLKPIPEQLFRSDSHTHVPFRSVSE